MQSKLKNEKDHLLNININTNYFYDNSLLFFVSTFWILQAKLHATKEDTMVMIQWYLNLIPLTLILKQSKQKEKRVGL
jgi:hypothetical protein